MIFTPGRRVLTLPHTGVQIHQRAGGAVAPAVDWSQWFDHCWVAKGAADLAASYTDLVGSQTLTPSPYYAAPALGADGWDFSGSERLHTGLTPTRTWSVIARIVNASVSSGNPTVVGCEGGGTTWRIILITDWWEQNGGSEVSYGAHPAAAVVGMTGAKIYLDGTPVATIAPAADVADVYINIGACGTGGNFCAYRFTGTIVACGIKAGALTDTQVADASAALAAL
jgi:hypothetical protein